MRFFQKIFIFTKMFVICVKTKIYHVMMLKKIMNYGTLLQRARSAAADSAE